MDEDRWVIYWHHPDRRGTGAGDQHYEEFEDEAAAREALAEFARCYPWNTYNLARLVASSVATEAEPDPFGYTTKPTVMVAGDGPKATATVTVDRNATVVNVDKSG